jgi:hypothetical protein
MHGVIPNYTPSEAMYFLSTKAYISENGFTSCSFRFFETLDDFYFVSDEYLIKYAVSENKVLKLVNAPQVSKDPKYLGQQIVSIESIEYPKRVDTAEDLHSGGYANRVIELDFMRKRVNLPEEQYFIYSKDSSFLDMNGKKHTPESYIHTQNFMEDTFTEENAKRFIVFRDYSRTGDIPGPLATNQFITEIIQRRVSYYHHLNSTAIAVSIKGRLDIAPGNVIELEMQELNASTNKSRNSQLSGNYLVHTVNNSVIGEELNTNLKLVKYDWSI